MTDHNVLIEKLSRSITPVKRPFQPVWRVISWLALALPSGLAASLLINRTVTDWSQTGAVWTIVQLLLTFVAGTLAIRNAFLLCIAGRTPLGWKWFLPLVVLWGACTFANFHLHHAPQPAGIEGLNCYLFMLGVSTPMALIVLGYLRRTRSLFPAKPCCCGRGRRLHGVNVTGFVPSHAYQHGRLTDASRRDGDHYWRHDGAGLSLGCASLIPHTEKAPFRSIFPSS